MQLPLNQTFYSKYLEELSPGDRFLAINREVDVIHTVKVISGNSIYTIEGVTYNRTSGLCTTGGTGYDDGFIVNPKTIQQRKQEG